MAIVTITTAAACRGGDSVTDAAAQQSGPYQIAFGARLTLTDSGVARATLVADSAHIHDDGLRMNLHGVRMVFVDTAGDSTGALTADRAVFSVPTSQLDASGAVSITAGSRVLQTPWVLYTPVGNLLRTDSSYTLNVGTPPRQSSGTGFESTPDLLQVGRPRPKQ